MRNARSDTVAEADNKNSVLFNETEKHRLLQKRNNNICCEADLEVTSTIVVISIAATSAGPSSEPAHFLLPKWRTDITTEVRRPRLTSAFVNCWGRMTSSPYMWRCVAVLRKYGLMWWTDLQCSFCWERCISIPAFGTFSRCTDELSRCSPNLL